MARSATGKARRKRWLLVAGAALVALGVGAAVFLLNRPQQSAGFVRTQTVTVTKSAQVVTVGVSGTLAPKNQADLSFSSAGTVTSVKVKVGQKVSKKEVLATIDNTDLANAVALARANLTAARTSYSDAVDNDASSSQLSSARAQIRSAAAQLSSARLALAKAKLRSTIDGVVALVNIAKGDTVTGGGSSSTTSGASSSSTSTSSSANIVVVSTKSWKVNATVGAADVATLKAGQSAKIAVTGTTTVLDGKVDSVGIVSTSSGGSASFPVVLSVTSSGTGVYSGVAVTATLTTGTYPDVLTVPTAAIVNVNGKTTVQQVKNGQQVTTEVVTGRVFGTMTEVTSGLAEGDEVAITTRDALPTGGASGGIQFGPGAGGPPPDGTGARPTGGASR